MIRSLSIAGLLVAFAGALGAQEVSSTLAARISWPDCFSRDFNKVDTGSFCTPGVADALVLAADQLIVVRSVGVGPVVGFVANDVSDFVVLPGDATGVSRFLAITSDGLWLGAFTGTQVVMHTLLATGDWRGAKSLSAYGSSPALVHVAGTDAFSSKLLRGQLANDVWTSLSAPPLPFPPPTVEQVVALDFDVQAPGPEIAYVTNAGLIVTNGTGSVTFSGPHSTLSAFKRIERIPAGNGVDDSLAFLVVYDQGGSSSELLYEIDRVGVTGPLHAGPLDVVDLDIARMGGDARYDLLAGTVTNAGIVVLHGTDHLASPYPFVALPNELYLVPLNAATIGYHQSNKMRLAGGDVDQDGDGDVVFVSQGAESDDLFVARGHDGIDGAPTRLNGTTIEEIDSGTFTRISFDLNLQVPPSMRVPTPDHLRVKVYTRLGVDPASYVTTTPWHANDYPVVNGEALVQFELDAPYQDVSQTLFYLELQPVDIVGQPAPVLGGITAWVAAIDGNNALIDELWCEEPDEFSECGIDPEVTAINRRSFVAPRQATPLP